MGREMASAFARWFAIEEATCQPVLKGVADLNRDALAWFENVPTVERLTEDYRELLADNSIDVVYVAVPHNFHAPIYLDVIAAGKDLFAEKPFGIDLDSAQLIQSAVTDSGSFVRCSSEFPFLPGAQAAFDYVRSGRCGRILEAVSGFHHASDLNPDKPGNWKRKSETCGEIGVLGDLGLHACHLPLRLGWFPREIYAQLSKGFDTRPDGRGGRIQCDTWDNALVNTWVQLPDQEPFPMRLEMKRLAPTETNTWFFSVVGTQGGVRYSTKSPKRLETFAFDSNGRQVWQSADLGFNVPFKTITGGIFEVGFPDIIQQMWAAFLEERAGKLDGRFGCATVREVVDSQRIFSAALESHAQQSVIQLASTDTA